MAAFMNLRGATALVTGGAVRIGRAICEALAEKGCNIVIHYNRSSGEAKDLAGRLRKTGVEVSTVKGDLSSPSGCRRIIVEAVKKAGKLDILVNNAAVFHKDSLMSATKAEFAQELDVNFLAPVMMIKEFIKRILSGDRTGPGVKGKIINLLDRRIAGAEGGCLPYLISKKMLAELTREAALELAPHITVNGVAPGAVLAPGLRQTLAEKKADRVKDMAGTIPLKKRSTPEDVARAIVFLLESDGITGQVIFVDGGQHLLGNILQS